MNAIATRLDTIQEKSGLRGVEIAQLLKTTPETVSRWRNDHSEPKKASLEVLLQLEWLVGELAELYSPQEAKLWLFSHHKQLSGQRPVDRIEAGRLEDILTIIAQLKDSAFV